MGKSGYEWGGMVGVGRSGYKWEGMVGVGRSGYKWKGVGYNISGVKERESHSEPLSWKGERWQSDWYHSSESS